VSFSFFSFRFCHRARGEIRDRFIKSFSCYPAVCATDDPLPNESSWSQYFVSSASEKRWRNHVRRCRRDARESWCVHILHAHIINRPRWNLVDNHRFILSGLLVGMYQDIYEWISSRVPIRPNRKRSNRSVTSLRESAILSCRDEKQWRVQSGLSRYHDKLTFKYSGGSVANWQARGRDFSISFDAGIPSMTRISAVMRSGWIDK